MCERITEASELKTLLERVQAIEIAAQKELGTAVLLERELGDANFAVCMLAADKIKARPEFVAPPVDQR